MDINSDTILRDIQIQREKGYNEGFVSGYDDAKENIRNARLEMRVVPIVQMPQKDTDGRPLDNTDRREVLTDQLVEEESSHADDL
jgi:hypothetical protein